MELMMKHNNKKLNCAIYCRISREDENLSQSTSIGTQKEILKEYAESNNWNIYDYYIDDGYTGTNFNRPAFQRMIKDIEAGIINVVITKDLSRLGRNHVDTGKYTEQYFPEHKVRYIAVNDNFDSEIGDEIAPFKNIINEWYARDISKKVRSMIEINEKKGVITNAKCPLFGYNYDDKNNRVINPITSKVVKRIFDMYIDGYNIHYIADVLTKEKIYTPSYYRYKEYNYNSKKYSMISEEDKYNWNDSAVRTILHNGLEYTGALVLGKTRKLSFKSKTRSRQPLDKRICHYNKYPAIISYEDYELACKRIKSNRSTPYNLEDNIFRNLLFCGECNSVLKMKKDFKSQKYTYICRCDDCKNKAYIKIDNIEKIINQSINDLMISINKHGDKIVDIVKTSIEENYSKNGYQIALIEKEISKLLGENDKQKRYIERLYDSKFKDEIQESIFQTLLKKYTTIYDNNVEQIKNLRTDINNLKSQTVSEEAILTFISELPNIELCNNASYKKVLNKVVLTKKDKGIYDVKIVFHKLNDKIIEVITNEK